VGHPDNISSAARLRELADLLSEQQANPFRVRAYRQAAETVDGLGESLAELVRLGGRAGLIALPAIGPTIADGILEMLDTGRFAQLERMRGTMDPEQIFRTLPGIGKELAHRIHIGLQVDSLAELETAAHEGRLATVPGIGARRAEMIRVILADRLARIRQRSRSSNPRPDVALLLDVDAEYVSKAASGDLPKIAPRRFNPTGEAWLPILHAQRGDWHLTALFSNTARAHELGRNRDWVVIYYHSDHEPEGQCTVVTESRGELVNHRVVRGREIECREHYG
jgi:putative hydrolase